jgi:hypothetical protein
MTENRVAAVVRAVASGVAVGLMVLLGVAIVLWMPLPDIDLPFDLRLSRPFDAPQPPWWLKWLPFLAGTGKFLVLGVIAGLVALAQTGKDRSDRSDGTTRVNLDK